MTEPMLTLTDLDTIYTNHPELVERIRPGGRDCIVAQAVHHLHPDAEGVWCFTNLTECTSPDDPLTGKVLYQHTLGVMRLIGDFDAHATTHDLDEEVLTHEEVLSMIRKLREAGLR